MTPVAELQKSTSPLGFSGCEWLVEASLTCLLLGVGLLVYVNAELARLDVRAMFHWAVAPFLLSGLIFTIGGLIRRHARAIKAGFVLSIIPALACLPFTFEGGATHAIRDARVGRIGGKDYVVTLKRNPQAMPLKDRAALDQLLSEYIPPPHGYSDDFNCKSFAHHLAAFAEGRGVRASLVVIEFEVGWRHAVVCFPCADGSQLFVDNTPSSDTFTGHSGEFKLRLVKVEVGKPYLSSVAVTVEFDSDGTITRLMGDEITGICYEGPMIAAVAFY